MKKVFTESNIKAYYSDRINNKGFSVKLHENINLKKFESTFWLKWELIDFCKKNNINCNGSKTILKEKIMSFLDEKTF